MKRLKLAINDDGEIGNFKELRSYEDKVNEYLYIDFIPDYGVRDYAFLYFNDKLYTGNTHEEIINNYCTQEIKDRYNEQELFVQDLDFDNYAIGSVGTDVAIIMDMKNVDINTISKILKSQLNVMKVYLEGDLYELKRVATNSRLKKLALDSREDDNYHIYESVKSSINSIKTRIDELTGLEELQSSHINSTLDVIMEYSEDIVNEITNAKSNGIYNEDQLREGRQILDDLGKKLEEVKSNLDTWQDSNTNLDEYIIDIKYKIEEVEEELANAENEITANKNTRLKKLSGYGQFHNYICDAHDDIKSLSQDMYNEVERAKETFNEYLSEINENQVDLSDNMRNLFHELDQKVESILYDIEKYVDEASEMNEKMGQGILRDIDEIEGLEADISDIEKSIEQEGLAEEEMKSELAELENTLSELKSKLGG